ncbi:MAG: hypothetical protein J5501_10735 [Ruminococcus sp.]|nr:hypothetical protein [Ruminococcus sp.]
MAGRYSRGDPHRSAHFTMSSLPDLPPEPSQTGERTPAGAFKELLSGKIIDRDTLLIAAVLLLMLREGGDRRLIMALAYIML